MHDQDIEIAREAKPSVHQESHADKPGSEMVENAPVILTEEDNVRIRRKTDRTILVILVWVYFLQVFDKAVVATAAVFGFQEDTNLQGQQYSLVSSISPIAQLAWQPFSAWLIVRVPHRILMPALILGWGIAEACIAACSSFRGLMAARFFLGLFEAGCMPLFTVITSQWYRRVEQPVRVSLWYSMNGVATMAASSISYGLGLIESKLLRPWQIIFLFAGLLTIVTAPLVYWKLDNDVASARFLTEEERLQAVERLRANKTGTGSSEFKWKQVVETAIDPKTWLWIGMAVMPNMGSALSSFFGPLIITGFGFNDYEATLLNIPFGFMQTLVIVVACWASYQLRQKSFTLVGFMLPVVAGIGMLYGLSRDDSVIPALLAAYYLLAFLFAANPLLLSWVAGNTGGATKQSATLAFYQAGVSAGALSGPLLFHKEEAPVYRTGVRGVLILFVVLIAAILMQLGILIVMNRMQRQRRVRNGKSAIINDQSMKTNVNADDKAQELTVADGEILDITDRENDEFVYIY